MKNRNKKSGKRLIITLIVIGLIIVFSYLSYKSNVYSPVDKSNDENISFEILKGTPVKTIAKNLEDQELINSDFSFYLYAKTHSLGKSILAGRFELNQTMNTPEILEILADPAKAQFRITIQEGLTSRDIDNKLTELNLIENGEFLEAVSNFNGWEYYNFLNKEVLSSLKYPVEGYLYPDSYFLNGATFKAQDMIYISMDNFEKKWQELLIPLGNRSMNEIITMASIIENEVRSSEDRKLVSGILWKRLDNGWPLGADATLLYITNDRQITQEDLNIDSPYNTRKNTGLPPGPISNPSIDSIKAALLPTASSYWFYLTTLDTGEVIYSQTNEEHNANRTKYL